MAISYKYAVKYNGKFYPPNAPIEVVENLAEKNVLGAPSDDKVTSKSAKTDVVAAQSAEKAEGRVRTQPKKEAVKKPSESRRKGDAK